MYDKIMSPSGNRRSVQRGMLRVAISRTKRGPVLYRGNAGLASDRMHPVLPPAHEDEMNSINFAPKQQAQPKQTEARKHSKSDYVQTMSKENSPVRL